MSTLRLSLAITAILAVAGLVRPAAAQIVSGLENGRHSGLFIEPDTFRPDFQFFAPADATDYETGADREANRGFFFQYDRLYWNISRPDSVAGVGVTGASEFQGDMTWGNRLEMGFIDCEDKGWSIVGVHIDGPNVAEHFYGFNPNYPRNPDQRGFPGIFGIGGDQLTPTAAAELVRANGDSATITNSVNMATYMQFELNRSFERQTFHNGGIWEPFVGLRYAQFRDRHIRSDLATIDLDFDGAADADQFIYDQGDVENDMLGAQVGFRIFKETGHWKLNTEARAFGMQNWQFFYTRAYSNLTTVAGGAAYFVPPQEINFDDSAFTWGGELRMDAAYALTRDINFRFGFTILMMDKIGRADVQVDAQPLLNPTIVQARIDQQDVFMGGLNFGFEVNR